MIERDRVNSLAINIKRDHVKFTIKYADTGGEREEPYIFISASKRYGSQGRFPSRSDLSIGINFSMYAEIQSLLSPLTMGKSFSVTINNDSEKTTTNLKLEVLPNSQVLMKLTRYSIDSPAGFGISVDLQPGDVRRLREHYPLCVTRYYRTDSIAPLLSIIRDTQKGLLF